MFKSFPILLFLMVYSYGNSQCYQSIRTNSNEFNGATIAVSTDGTLWGWGYNTLGTLGLGLGPDSFSTIFPNTQIGTATNWSSNFELSEHILAIKTDGTLWTWGYNDNGQCGNGTDFNTNGSQNFVLSPEQIGNDLWIDVAVGSYHSLGVKIDGTLWAWGENSNGQLGTGNTLRSTIPIQIGISSNWLKVFTSDRTSFAIKSDGSLWSWGLNNETIGRTNGNYSIPGQVGNSMNWLTIDVSSFYVSGIKTDGTLWVWGRNTSQVYNGYYGNGNPDTNNYENNPTQIGTDDNWQNISTSFNNSIAIKNDGTLWGWGKNQFGDLGDGTAITRYTPVQLGIDNDWVDISAYTSYFRAFAIKQNNSLYKWGAIGYNGPLSISIPSLNGVECVLGNDSFSTTNVVKVFPNPTSDSVTIQFTEKLSDASEVIVTNSIGQRITKFSVDFQSYKSEIKLDVRDFSSGLYCITLKSGTNIYHLKIIKN